MVYEMGNWAESLDLKSTGDSRRHMVHIIYIYIYIAQLVKNLPKMQETLVQFLGWEDPLEKGKATHSSILTWRVPRTIHSPRRGKESICTSPLPLCKLSGGQTCPMPFTSYYNSRHKNQ